MIRETKHCLAHLTDFEGREARQTFWLYVLALVILQFLIGILAAIPLGVSMFDTIFEGVQGGADPADMEGLVLASMSDGLETTFWISSAANVLTAALFVAAFVRRLHDAGFAGYWAVIPLAAQAVSIAYGFSQIDDLQTMFASAPDVATMEQMEADLTSSPASYISWIGYIVVIGFGVLKSQEGPNRYGEEPVRF